MGSYRKHWLALIAVLIVTFSLLGYYGREVYRQAPPIPDRVATAGGEVLYTQESILDGQTVIATHPRSFDRRRQIERIAQGMGHGVSLHGIEDKTIGQQEEDRKQDAHPAHAEPARHIPGRAAAKLSAAIAFFIQLSKGTFSKAAGHAEQGGNPHPEYGAGPTGGDRQRHPGKIAAADPGGKAGTERLKGR